MRLAQLDWRAERRRIISAFKQFHSSNPKRKTGSKYFIAYKGHVYPPKDIRSIVQDGRAKNEFRGGDTTNRIFYDLGFTVVTGIDKADLYTRRTLSEELIQLPKVPDWWDELSHKEWAPLNSTTLSAPELKYPGVYLLAYSDGLNGKAVRLDDVFYVGMSASSLALRLRQFLKGIEDGGHHSGAVRFYRRWAGEKAFSEVDTNNEFFVVTLSNTCEPDKGLRTPGDLQNLGLVAALEYFALAKIKQHLSLEPPLNKK